MVRRGHDRIHARLTCAGLNYFHRQALLVVVVSQREKNNSFGLKLAGEDPKLFFGLIAATPVVACSCR